MGKNLKLSRKEKATINRLRKLQEYWPDSLWIFCNGHSMTVLKCNDAGERVYEGRFGGVDPDYVVTDVNIPHDGGDW